MRSFASTQLELSFFYYSKIFLLTIDDDENCYILSISSFGFGSEHVNDHLNDCATESWTSTCVKRLRMRIRGMIRKVASGTNRLRNLNLFPFLFMKTLNSSN